MLWDDDLYDWMDESLFPSDLFDNEKAKKAAARKALAKGRELLSSPFFFHQFLKDVRQMGLVGEELNALAVYVTGVSRLRPRPLNLLLKGTSSAGKNFLAKMVLKFLPSGRVHEISSMSERSLNFMSSEQLQNSILYFYEIGGRSIHPFRLIISEGKLVHWWTGSSKGRKETREEVTGGPVACISTTTRDRLEIDDESRHLSIRIDESPEQTRRIVRAYTSHGDDSLPIADLRVWHAVQHLLEQRVNLPIDIPPSFDSIVDLIPLHDLRIRRYWPGFVEACKTICLIRSFARPQAEIKKRRRLLVSFTDFAIANQIFEDVITGSLQASTAEEELQTARIVARLAKRKGKQGVQASDLMGEPGIKSTDRAYRLLRRAEEAGTIYRTNPTQKSNAKFFLRSPSTAFVGPARSVFDRLTSPERLKFVDPVTGKWVVWEREESDDEGDV